jgi:FkbM family methyltransferase
MKIVIDLQSIQGISKNRGIGRYSLSLSQELIRQAGKHEIYLLFNGNMLTGNENILHSFDNLIPHNRIKIFEAPKKISGHDYSNLWNIKAAEKIREHFISTLCPDIVYISSIFEGWIEDVPISIGEYSKNSLTAATLYDLIPFIYSDLYIKKYGAPYFFFQKMQYLKKSDLLITLSDSGSKEAIDHLAFPTEKIINCSVGLDSKFKKYNINDKKKIEIKKEYSINRDFIFYIGGLDYRKNVEGLIEAFTLLPNRKKFQLVIIVSANEETIKNFNNFYKSRFNINFDELILISYVSEENLLTFYNICSVFVFPSLHEGFGLPIIEAMACGAPTIASNLSSMPEAIGCKEALFDPKRPQSIANKIYEVVTNESFKKYLIEHGEKQVKKFTWVNSAKKTLNAFEEMFNNKENKKFFVNKRKKMAYISPLPPEKTGVADYSARLIPELACFYEIILITKQDTIDDMWLKANFPIHNLKWFSENVDIFDILLYQFGNSSYHHYMIDLLNLYPGIVLLHDFYISGLLDWMEDYLPKKKFLFSKNLYISHGYPALIYQEKEGRINTHHKYPCNLSILKKASGIIVHSEFTVELARKWYGENIVKKIKSINHLVHTNVNNSIEDKNLAKEKLGFQKKDFLICTFGNLHPNKLNHRIIFSSIDHLLNHDNIFLIFIGEKPYSSYFELLSEQIKKNNLIKKIKILGFSERKIFQNYLVAADVAIQLRENSRGETSGCLLTCLSYGIPTITNAHGSISELPNDIIIKLNSNFTDFELTEAIDTLHKNKELRSELSHKASTYIKKNCHPAKIGEEFYRIIENFYDTYHLDENNLIKNLINYNIPHIHQNELIGLAKIVAANRRTNTYPQLLLDISNLIDNKEGSKLELYKKLLQRLVNTTSNKFRPEPVYFDKNRNDYFYAYAYTSNLLNISIIPNFQSLPIDIREKDIFIAICPNICNENLIINLNKKNIKIYFLICEEVTSTIKNWLKISDGVFCLNKTIYASLNIYAQKYHIKKDFPIKICVLNNEKIEDLSKNLIEIISSNNWESELKNNINLCPEIISINRDIYIDKIKYNFVGDIQYLSNAPKDFDVVTLSIFKNFCKYDSNVLDLGANIGFTTLALSDICSKGKIAAIEPLEPTFNFLKENIDKADKNNILLYQCAVGNKKGEIPMQATHEFLAGAFIADKYQADHKYFTLNVNVDLLDNIFNKFKLNKLDFIKMDLEGYELFALEGATKILTAFQPTVFLEMNHWCLNVFHRICLPEFQERLCKIFPFIYAIEYPNFLDFTNKDNFYHIAHEHITTTRKYFDLIAGFNQNELIEKLTKTIETIRNINQI